MRLPSGFFAFVWYFLKEYKSATALYVFLAFLAGLWGPFNSLMIKKIIDVLPSIDQRNSSILLLYVAMLVMNFVIFDNITWRTLGYLRYRYLSALLNTIYSNLVDETLQHSHQYFQDRMSGSLAKNIFHVIDGIYQIIYSIAQNFIRALCVLIASFICAYYVNTIFFIILVLWSVLFFIISIYMSKNLSILSEQQAAQAAILNGGVVDSLANAFSIKIFANKEYELKLCNNNLINCERTYQKQELYTVLVSVVQGTLIALMMGFISYFLAKLYINKSINIGDVALILGISMELGHMMWFTMSRVHEFMNIWGRVKQSLASLMVPFDIVDNPHAQILHNIKGVLEFKSVTFSYGDSTPLFRNLSIHIACGQKVGLVGYSGSGKSSFVNLILRLYEINQGSISIDNHNIKDIRLESLRNNIALIPQDTSLFHRSLMENIRYGRIDATDQEVIEAAKSAHAHEFIEQLPQGYATLVGERGVKLSGGQRQRIAIARAILKNAPIIILDEATAALDSLTEHNIQSSLLNAMHNRTSIVIAHRISTLLYMDRILVFDKGFIVEDGSHEQLLKNDGLYKKLWDTQQGNNLYETKEMIE